MKPWSQGWLIAAGVYPGFCSMKRLEVFLLPLDGMLVHRRSLPRNFVKFPQQIAGTHLYMWVERGTVRVKCLAQEHNTLSPARAWTRTARSRVECTNHKATAPPTILKIAVNKDLLNPKCLHEILRRCSKQAQQEYWPGTQFIQSLKCKKERGLSESEPLIRNLFPSF